MLYLPYVSLWMHYALSPVTLIDASGEQVAVPVRHVLGADVVATVTVWRGLEFGLGVPLTLYSWGDDISSLTTQLEPAPGFAMGDLTIRVGYRFRLAENTALAIHVPVLLPTSGEDNVLGLSVGARPTVAVLQRLGRVELLFNLFVLGRANVDTIDFRGGTELGFRFGLRVSLRNWWTSLLFEGGFTTSVMDFFSPANTPAELRVGAEHWFDYHWRLSGFVGVGISPSVGAPDVRIGLAVAYGTNPWYRPLPEPAPSDRDGDGILDHLDECPTEPEDPDGFEDEDGCPDDDNDQDGIMDWDDACPTAPETMNGISDEDGCPDRIRLDDTLIATFERVHFRTGSEEILEDSFPMLEEIAAVLRVNPSMEIRIEGHTDSVGDDDANMELSQQRAESVRRFLMEHEVGGDQLTAEGLGETRSIASNNTDQGRAQNRRVEFHIVQEEE